MASINDKNKMPFIASVQTLSYKTTYVLLLRFYNNDYFYFYLSLKSVKYTTVHPMIVDVPLLKMSMLTF